MPKTPNNFKVNPTGTPATNLKPEPKKFQPARPARLDEIPIINISCLQSKNKTEMLATANQIRQACERIGFFYIVNHGVPQKVVDKAFTESKRFFNQPDSIKQSLLFDENDHGYKGPGNIAIPGYPPDHKEVLDFGVDLAADHADVVAGKPFHGPNQWPPSTLR